jgi:OFA family oxalate/formate antiporter-like MFS transporter
MTQETTNQGLPNRWLLAGGGVLMQLALGALYAWSVFRIPLSKAFGWSIQDVTRAFSLALLVLGFVAFIGGLWMRRVGRRIVGITAAVCYGLGVALSGLSGGNIWILWLSYGVGGNRVIEEILNGNTDPAATGYGAVCEVDGTPFRAIAYLG